MIEFGFFTEKTSLYLAEKESVLIVYAALQNCQQEHVYTETKIFLRIKWINESMKERDKLNSNAQKWIGNFKQINLKSKLYRSSIYNVDFFPLDFHGHEE